MNKRELAETTKDPDILNKLSQDKDYGVRFYVAYNPATKTETLDVLSRDKDSDVRYWVAVNRNTKPETLDVLSRDKNPYIRYRVAANPNCSERAYKYIKGLELLKSLSKVST